MLPAVEKGKTLEIKHFPTKFQALIFRLWESVPAKRLAQVLSTDEETIKKLAYDMGLGEQRWLEKWMERGYISIIRHSWNILPYNQLCELLDWSAERLAFILKEDDFLDVKLGGWNCKKTDCEVVSYRPLTKAEKERTEQIYCVVKKELRPFENESTEAPFDFFRQRYKGIAERKTLDVTIDSDWCVEIGCRGAEEYIKDFKTEIKNLFDVTFCDKSEKTIKILMTLQSDDEEYHEIDIKKDCITVNAAFPVGIMRGLYFLLDMANGVGAPTFEKKSYKRKTKIKTRFIYSFCGLYSDVLDKDSRISFPDELLRGYARQGINGVWIQGVFYKIAPYPFDEEKCIGWEKRLENLDELTRRCARFGIKVYMYINEPRNMPLSFFEKFPELKGASLKPGFACLCSSNAETHKYLKNAVQTICRRVPLLGGFLNITQSENLVLCHSSGNIDGNKSEDIVPCCVCSKKNGAVVTAQILNTMAEAAFEINKDIKYFAYAWEWKKDFANQLEELLGNLNKNIIILQVSETGIKFNRGGVENEVRDYSLSIVGPGESAKDLWAQARKYGLEVASKVQINNSWECSTAPFLPVYENVIRHMKNLTDAGVEHIMLSWTLGGYISDNIKIASEFFFENEGASEDAYDSVLKRTYGEYSECVKKAVSHFCKGFSEYPFDCIHIYDGPSNAGAANLIYTEPTGMHATMTCYPYDDLNDWCAGVYTPEILKTQYEKLCFKWEKGLAEIKELPPCDFKDMAFYGYTLFKASLNQISYYILRDGECDREKMREIVKSEKETALLAYQIMLRNSSVGYEAANHYYVTRSAFMEKVINCEWILDNI